MQDTSNSAKRMRLNTFSNYFKKRTGLPAYHEQNSVIEEEKVDDNASFYGNIGGDLMQAKKAISATESQAPTQGKGTQRS